MDLSPSRYVQQKSLDMDYPFHMCTRNYPTQIRHNPHPFNVRNIKGFLGLPTRMVETEDKESMAARRTVEHYVSNSLKRGDWNFSDNPSVYVKKSKDLDSILALQYFTGLKSYSFKENYLPYLGYREYFNDWRRQLRHITEAAYKPLLDAPKAKEYSTVQLQHPNEWFNGQSGLTRSKTMYSETGRLTTRQGQTISKSSHRPNSQRLFTSSNDTSVTKATPNLNELDAVVFMLLADLLQTQSVHLIQNWLSRATERERALITSMLQTALSKPPVDLETDVHTARKTTKVSDIEMKTYQNGSHTRNMITPMRVEEANILVVDAHEMDAANIEEIRPPTSSTFRISKAQTDGYKENMSRTKVGDNTRDTKTSVWSQMESIKN